MASSYRAVNSLHLGCDNQSLNVVLDRNCCSFSEIYEYTKHINDLCRQNLGLMNVTPTGYV